MRNRSMSTAGLCLALALCPAVVGGDPTPVSVEVADDQSTLPPAGSVDLQWWVIGSGGGVSAGDGLVLSGAIAELSGEPFAVLRGFDSPELGTPAETPVTEFALAPISPNPSRGSAQISWSLPVDSRVRLTIHDIQGREVEVLADGPCPAGRHDVAWRAGARGAGAAGMYFVRLQIADRVLVRRMAVIR